MNKDAKDRLRSFEKSRGNTTDGSYLTIVGLLVVVVCAFVVGFFAGKLWGGYSGSSSENFVVINKDRDETVTELDFNLFWDVWSTLLNEYVDEEITEEDLFYGALKGLASGTGDPVTVFLTPDETKQYNEGNAGKFEGIGAELGYEDGALVIVSPLEGSPALDAGLRPGDRILAVDGKDVSGENIFEVVDRIRGDAGTDVVLTVVPRNQTETEDVTVTRGEITVPSITYEGTENGIAVVDVDRFTESSVSLWQSRWDSAIREVVRDDPDALILDLRGNPGGYFNAAVWAAGDFLPKDALIAEQYSRDGLVNTFSVARKGNLPDIPLVVLVNNASASASEILAGALQYHDRAVVIGESTYGKGTAQQVLDYPGGSSLHLTTLKWVLPDGRNLDPDNVIEPDTVVELTDDDFKKGADPQMDAARDYLNSL